MQFQLRVQESLYLWVTSDPTAYPLSHIIVWYADSDNAVYKEDEVSYGSFSDSGTARKWHWDKSTTTASNSSTTEYRTEVIAVSDPRQHCTQGRVSYISRLPRNYLSCVHLQLTSC